jgi:DNA-binding transcriptional ArsR family regulator
MEVNESKLIEAELTLRDLRITKDVLETRRSMVRWLALALGIISPGESRLSAVSVLDAILYFQFQEKKDPTVEELSDYINKKWSPINEKTLRYHLLQLKKAGIVNNSKGKYFLKRDEGIDSNDIVGWVNSYIDSRVEPIKGKIANGMSELKNRP